ncbi:MAG: GlsB/YeaQ/YmgE family stress response membrane protein, partial [Hyphomicrobium sp.]
MDYVAYLREHPALVIMVLNGLVAGWLAGLLLGGGGLIRNLLVGIIGAIVGGWMVSQGFLTLPYNF